MRKRLAYLVGARITPRSERHWIENPRPEFVTFAERNECAILDYGTTEQCGSASALAFLKRGLPHVALAATAAHLNKNHDAFLVSGEDVGLPLALFLRLRGIGTPTYIITHGSYFRSPKFLWLMRLIRRFRDVHFLCLSESLRKSLEKRFGVAASQTHNAGYGVDTEFFQPRADNITGRVSPAARPGNSEAVRPLIASAGTATRDYRTLVTAAAQLPVEVKIAADSAWFPASVDISGENLPPNVEARSYGNYVGLRDLYASASFVVVPLYPALHACGYAVIIEAMAMGKPVIATRTEAHSDFICEGRTGYYVPPCDVQALRDKIQFLLERPSQVREMGDNARRMISERFSLEAYCTRMEQIMGLPGRT